ncbi:MAG: spinster family MFS transporter [Candidatus Binatia bacterium]
MSLSVRETTVPLAATEAVITPQYRRYAMLVLVLVFTSSHIDRQILAILLEPIKQELQLSDTQLGFLSGVAFAIFYATLGIPMAMWADRGNRRNLITFALALWSGMTALCGLATNFWQLALARIGVGVGEAGSNPPSHSMISDMYPPSERAGAMGTFSLGINFGLMAGFLVGGWVNQWYGWRMAFYTVGLPGLLLAVVVRYTLREPPRGYAEGLQSTPHEAPSLKAVVRHMASTPSLRHLAAGATLASFVGYGVVLWLPAFLVRSHGLQSGQIGTALAFLFGVIGGISTYAGGQLADYLGKRDVRWNVWIIALAIVIALPFTVAAYLATDIRTATLYGIIPALMGGVYLGPSFALNQGLVPVRMRSVASAILLFIVNIIGLGLGPQTVGVISDLLKEAYGTDSLRYALICLSGVNLWTAIHYVFAARSLQTDLQKANNPGR